MQEFLYTYSTLPHEFIDDISQAYNENTDNTDAQININVVSKYASI